MQQDGPLPFLGGDRSGAFTLPLNDLSEPIADRFVRHRHRPSDLDSSTFSADDRMFFYPAEDGHKVIDLAALS